MQLKYKYNLSTEGRKSSATPAQTAKHDVLPYINILDKCTRKLAITQKSLGKTAFGSAISWRRMTQKSSTSSKRLASH